MEKSDKTWTGVCLTQLNLWKSRLNWHCPGVTRQWQEGGLSRVTLYKYRFSEVATPRALLLSGVSSYLVMHKVSCLLTHHRCHLTTVLDRNHDSMQGICFSNYQWLVRRMQILRGWDSCVVCVAFLALQLHSILSIKSSQVGVTSHLCKCNFLKVAIPVLSALPSLRCIQHPVS